MGVFTKKSIPEYISIFSFICLKDKNSKILFFVIHKSMNISRLAEEKVIGLATEFCIIQAQEAVSFPNVKDFARLLMMMRLDAGMRLKLHNLELCPGTTKVLRRKRNIFNIGISHFPVQL